MLACLLLLPFAEAGFSVVGFDTNSNRIKELTDAYDKTFEVENKRLDNPNITYTDNADDIGRANFPHHHSANPYHQYK